MSALEEWKGMQRGLVRVGAGPSLATYLLPPVLNNFHKKWPGVDADIQTGSSSQLIDALQNGEIDLAIVVAHGSAEESSIRIAIELRFEVTLVSCISEAPKHSSLQELTSLPFLLFRRGARIENLIDEYFGIHHFSPNVIMRFDSAEALKSTILSGLGVSMLPSYVVAKEVSSGALRQIQQTEPSLIMIARVLLRKAEFVPPAVRAFISILGETMSIAR